MTDLTKLAQKLCDSLYRGALAVIGRARGLAPQRGQQDDRRPPARGPAVDHAEVTTSQMQGGILGKVHAAAVADLQDGAVPADTPGLRTRTCADRRSRMGRGTTG